MHIYYSQCFPVTITGYGLYDNWTSRIGDKNFDQPADVSLIDTNIDYNKYAFRFLIDKGNV